MDSQTSRPLRVNRPWPTAFQQSERIVRPIAVLAALQFFLNGLSNVLEGWAMLAIWVAFGSLVGVATLRIERYLARRRTMVR